MKAALAIFGLILGLLIMQNSWGAESAYQRECRIAGGEYWSVTVKSEFDTPLCRFSEGVIGAEVFAQYKWNKTSPQALNVYLKTPQTGSPDTICQQVGAAYVVGADTNRDFWRLCIFPDDSIIGADTLANGTQSRSNALLNSALGL